MSGVVALKLFLRGDTVPSYIESVRIQDGFVGKLPKAWPQFRPRVTVAMKWRGTWHLFPFFMDKRNCVIYMQGSDNCVITGGPTQFHWIQSVHNLDANGNSKPLRALAKGER